MPTTSGVIPVQILDTPMRAARRVERAVMEVVARHMKSMEAGKMGLSTSEVGDLVVKYVEEDRP